MKFPLKERPFDRVQLTPHQSLALEQLADAVVDATLKEFHEYVHLRNRSLAKDQWKPVKKRENVTVYRELTAKQDRVFGVLGVRNETLALNTLLLPKLLAVGTVHGNMHDMMLGTALHDAASVLVKSSYVEDALVDCSVLHEMRGPTHDDPFRYMALKWLVKAHPSGLNGIVAPRDMVVVQSSGLVPGQNIGYHVLHSVDLPECHSLEARHSILRSRISTAFIFRQLTPDVVEVFVPNYVEPNGSAPESVAVISTAKSMNCSWKSIDCSHNMKLAWILKNKEVYMGTNHHTTLNTDDKCEICFNRATLAGKLADCALCDARICSRCRVTKKLSHANRRLELQTTKHECCKTCLYRVINEDAKRVAAELYAGEPITPWHVSTTASQNPGYRFTNGSAGQGQSSRVSSDTVSSSGWRSHRSHVSGSERSTSPIDDDAISISSDGSVQSSNSDDWAYARPQYPATSSVAMVKPIPQRQYQYPNDAPVTHQGHDPRPMSLGRGMKTGAPDPTPAQREEFWQLYAKMQALQVTAEKTFELAQDNSRKLAPSGH